MSYRPIFVSQRPRFSLDRHEETGMPVLSLPVSNQMTEYEECYAISEEELERFLRDETRAIAFALRCGKRMEDERLVLKPGSDRGHYSG